MWLVYDRFCVCWIEKRIKFTKIPFMVWLFEKNDIPLHSQTKGTLAEWLGNGLQNRVRRFESARYLTRRGVSHDTPRLFSCIVPDKR